MRDVLDYFLKVRDISRTTRAFGIFRSLGIAGIAAFAMPAQLAAEEWQPRQDGRLVAQASNTEPFKISGTDANGRVTVRIQWWNLLGQPVESYKMNWGVDEASSTNGDLFRPFVRTLPNEGDLSQVPDIAAAMSDLRSTDAGMRVEFTIRAPRKAIKGSSFYTRCEGGYCYARGVRDLDRLVLPMGKINDWSSSMSPGTPSDNMIANWQEPCRATLLECQQNTLRAGSDIRIDRLSVWKLTYDHSQAKKIVADWATAAQDQSEDVQRFRRMLAQLSRPFSGTGSGDPEAVAAEKIRFYTDNIAEAGKLQDLAVSLDTAVWNQGNHSGERKYFNELEAARREIARLRDAASLELAQARVGTALTREQIAELKGMERAFAREERAIMEADGRITASDKAGLDRAKAMKQRALTRLAGGLLPLGQRIDATKRDWGASDEENSFAQRASKLAASLQRDLREIGERLDTLQKSEKKRYARAEASREAKIVTTTDAEIAIRTENSESVVASSRSQVASSPRFDGFYVMKPPGWERPLFFEVIRPAGKRPFGLFWSHLNPQKPVEGALVYATDHPNWGEYVSLYGKSYAVLKKTVSGDGIVIDAEIIEGGELRRTRPGASSFTVRRTSCSETLRQCP